MDTQIIVYIALWFLLPLIPAYILFKSLPSTAIVTGPLQGLKINLGGAFAGYFLLFLVAMPVMKKLIFVDDFEVWVVKGKVLDSRTNLPIDVKNNPRIMIQPPNKIQDAGNFDVKLIGEINRTNMVRFPTVEIQADGYVPVSLESMDYKRYRLTKRRDCEMNAEDKNALFATIKLTRVPDIALDKIPEVPDDK
jgi:hypothetical protein